MKTIFTQFSEAGFMQRPSRDVARKPIVTPGEHASWAAPHLEKAKKKQWFHNLLIVSILRFLCRKL